jgi:hypothetical protein
MGFSKRFKTQDSALAFYVNQLENLDRRLYMPLTSVSWSRDVKLRPGITMSDETTSFVQSTFATPGTLFNGNGSTGGAMPWISPETTDLPGVSIDGQKYTSPLRLLGREISFTSVELDRSQLLGQPIDAQKTDAMNIGYNMNIDQMCYIGAPDVLTNGGPTQGLLNSSQVTSSTVAAGISGFTQWIYKTADEMLADVNTLLVNTWLASAYAITPSKLLLPPANYSYIASQKVSTAGNISILKFLQENSIALKENGKELDIQPVKWLGAGLGAGGSNRMVAYTNDESRVRFPMVPIRRETAYYKGIRFFAPYIWAFGVMEFVYPETVQYADGI